MHARDPVPALRPLVTGWLPDELESLIARCLAKDPHHRPANARALLAELRAIEIPADHAWTDAGARAWWTQHRAPEDQAPAMPADVERVIVTQHEPMVAGPEAKTVVSGRRS